MKASVSDTFKSKAAKIPVRRVLLLEVNRFLHVIHILHLQTAVSLRVVSRLEANHFFSNRRGEGANVSGVKALSQGSWPLKPMPNSAHSAAQACSCQAQTDLKASLCDSEVSKTPSNCRECWKGKHANRLLINRAQKAGVVFHWVL